MRFRAVFRWALALLSVLCTLAAPLQAGELPQDQGVAGLQQKLRQLRTTARLLHTTAHPDDEDGAMLTLEARGRGASVVLLTLTRGEGGQNKLGSNLLDVLGVVRTLELLASDRYYGVEQRFTRVADFGYSKTAAETFEKWHGHDIALADMVRVIRTLRPDVIVSRFQGASRDGHGHHEAAGILTREAFRAAADPNRFPEQIREGLQPWQAKKLYVDNVRPRMSTAPPPPEAYTVALDTGANDSLLGTSYAQFAMQGLRRQLSQGADAWNLRAGPHVSYYKLADSVLPMPPEKHEQDFFDGIDTTLPGLAARLGGEETRVPFLCPALVEIAARVDEAANAATPGTAASLLLNGYHLTGKLIDHVRNSALSPIAKADLLASLEEKRKQFRDAANLALGVELKATLDGPPAAAPQQITMAVPGQSFTLTATLTNHGSRRIECRRIVLDMPHDWKAVLVTPGLKTISPGQSCFMRYRVDVPAGARPTRPHWHRADPQRDTIYTVDSPASATLALPPPPLHARAEFTCGGDQGEVVQAAESAYRDEHGDLRTAPLWVGAPLSVATGFATQVIPLRNPAAVAGVAVRPASSSSAPAQSTPVNVKVGSNLPTPVSPAVRLETTDGWRSDPPSAAATIAPGAPRELTFTLHPTDVREGEYAANAIARLGANTYAEGYTVVSRADTGAFPYYQPATERIRVVAVNTPPALKVGYVEGAGDEIPTVLRQIGLDVTILSDQDLATADLSRFATIVLGIRAYDTREALRTHNQRLLDFVSSGGTLLVQYNSGLAEFNSGRFTPYQAQLSRDRVSAEDAPVELLVPQDPIFNWPNRITARDFDGWIQERGLYFMGQWDPRFEPLLASHDPGEPPHKGGLLRARYGKGLYIYTGYAFFRQLPAGVPGAIRLFVNLVSAGHAQEAAP
ncbi:MAG: PIG-L family deacetylase [Terriglobales bacterium]